MSKMDLSKSLRADRKAYRDKVMQRLCSEIRYAEGTSINGKIPYGFLNKLLKKAATASNPVLEVNYDEETKEKEGRQIQIYS